MSEDLNNVKQRITALTLQTIGAEVENKMIDIEKQSYVNTGIVQCANEIFMAIDRSNDHVKKSDDASIECFVSFLSKQLTLIRDGAHSKYNECSGRIMAYQDIISIVSKRIKDVKIKSESTNVGTRPEERESIDKRRVKKRNEAKI